MSFGRIIRTTVFIAFGLLGCKVAPPGVCHRVPRDASWEQATAQICQTENPTPLAVANVQRSAEAYLQETASNWGMRTPMTADPRFATVRWFEGGAFVCFLEKEAGEVCTDSPQEVQMPPQDGGSDSLPPSHDAERPTTAPTKINDAGASDAMPEAAIESGLSMEVHGDGGAIHEADAEQRPIKTVRPPIRPRRDGGSGGISIPLP